MDEILIAGQLGLSMDGPAAYLIGVIRSPKDLTYLHRTCRGVMAALKPMSLLFLAAFALACGSDDGTEPPVDNWLRFEFAGDTSGRFEVSGMPVFPNDNTRNFVALAEGRVNHTNVSHQVLAVKARSDLTPNGFDMFLMFLNPSVGRSGHFGAGDCPEPEDFSACAMIEIRLGVPIDGGIEQIGLSAIPDSTVLTIHRITPDTLHAAFHGRFTLFIPDQPLGRATVTNAEIFAVRVRDVRE